VVGTLFKGTNHWMEGSHLMEEEGMEGENVSSSCGKEKDSCMREEDDAFEDTCNTTGSFSPSPAVSRRITMGVRGIQALEEWCRRAVQGYPGIHVVDMSSSWKDGRAFCALIHRHRPDLLDFDSLDSGDWAGNCALAFGVAERELGIPALLDVEDLVQVSSPDKFSVMTYLAQFYHKFTEQDPDSGFSSQGCSSGEEDSPLRRPVALRQGAMASLLHLKRTRPVSWHGRGRLEVRLPSIPLEQENPFLHAEMRGEDEVVRSLTRHQHVAEPTVKMRVKPGPPGKDRMTRSLHIESSALTAMWSSGSGGEERCKVRRPHSTLGMSHTYTPYTGRRQRGCDSASLLGERALYVKERRRRRSEEGVEFNNQYNQARLKSQTKKDPLVTRVKMAPQNISETQKLLRLNFAQVKPLNANSGLRLDIFKVKYQKTSGQGSNLKATMKLSKTNLKQLQRVNHPDKNYMLEKFLSQSNKSEDKWSNWDRQLASSIEYWHKRFPSCSSIQAVA